MSQPRSFEARRRAVSAALSLLNDGIAKIANYTAVPHELYQARTLLRAVVRGPAIEPATESLPEPVPSGQAQAPIPDTALVPPLPAVSSCPKCGRPSLEGTMCAYCLAGISGKSDGRPGSEKTKPPPEADQTPSFATTAEAVAWLSGTTGREDIRRLVNELRTRLNLPDDALPDLIVRLYGDVSIADALPANMVTEPWKQPGDYYNRALYMALEAISFAKGRKP